MAFYRCGAETPAVSDEPKSVVFYDYDGTLLYQYTKTEFLALTVMPNSPAHTRLTPQGWNWSLSDAKTYVTNHTYLDIGRSYTTSSDKTEIDITLVNGALEPVLKFTRNSGTVTVDWGDGSALETDSSNTNIVLPHTYSVAGDYTIKIEGDITIIGGTGNFGYLLNSSSTATAYANHEVYMNCVKGVHLSSTANIGNYAFAYFRQLEYVTLSSNVTMIPTYAFYYCESLKHITIPNSVTKIITAAFYGCFSLESVCLPHNLTRLDQNTFRQCKMLKQVTISDEITFIGSYCFTNCYELKRAVLPSNYSGEFPDGIFSYCHALKDVNIPTGITTVGQNAFSESGITSVYIPTAGFVSGQIKQGAFQNCRALKTVQIEDSAKTFSIGNNAFASCPKLNSINLPNSITSIGNMVFYGSDCIANSLTYLKLPKKAFPSESSASTNYQMVANCPLLETVEFAEGATVVGSISGCWNVKNIIVPEGVTTIGAKSIVNAESMYQLTLPSTLIYIRDNSIQNCYALSSITIPNNVTTIGQNVFLQCYGLSEINISNSINSIGNYFAKNCTSLKHLIIPSSLYSIGNYFLQGCTGLEYIKFEGSTPPAGTVGSSMLSGVPTTCKILVPTGSLSAYQTKFSSLSAYTFEEY